jgi:uncharacterized glyoxalase superfamily metalloenzyme YdcJ
MAALYPAAGILGSNQDSDVLAGDEPTDGDYGSDWMAGAIPHHIHDPYALYERAAR